MKIRNRIILLITAVLTVALLVVGMTLVASAEDGTQTKYGVLPTSVDADATPFAIFHKAAGAEEWTFVTAVADAFDDAVFTDEILALDGELAVLMLKDVNLAAKTSTFSEAALLGADITFDLDSHKLINRTAGDNGLFYLKPIVQDADKVRNITVKNGTITVGSQNVTLHGNAKVALTHALTLNVNFENITFDWADGTTTDQPIVQAAKDTTVYTVNYVFDECTFDLTGRKSGATYLFVGYRGAEFNETTTKIIGGEIRTETMSGLTTVLGSKVNFVRGENGYVVFRVPVGVNASMSLNDKTLPIIKMSTDDVYDYYSAEIGEITEYGEIPKIYENKDENPFAIFHKAPGASEYTLFRVCPNPWVDNVLDKYWALEGELVIYMRTNVDLSAYTYSTPNLIRVNPDMIVDFGGNTFTSPTATEKARGMFYIVTRSLRNGTGPRYLTFKNGTVVTKAEPFVIFGGMEDPGEEYVYNATFEGINFKCAEGATKEQPFVQVAHSTLTHTVNVTYNDCTFDVTNNVADKVYLFTVGNSGNTKGNSSLTVNVKVNGGEIRANTADVSKLQLILHDKVHNPGGVAFGPDANGEYTKLVMPNGVANCTQSVTNSGGTSVIFLPKTVGATHTTHELVPTLATQYIPKMSVTLSSDLIYNLYIPVDNMLGITLGGVEYDRDTLLKNYNKRVINEKTYIHVPIANGIMAAGEDIELVSTIKVNALGETATITQTVGILEYARVALGGELTAVESTLVKNMLNYLRSVNLLLSNDAVTTAIDGMIGADYDPEISVNTAVESTAGLVGAAMYIDNYPALVFHLENGEDGKTLYDPEKYVFYIGDRAVKGEISVENGETYIYLKAFAYEIRSTVSYYVVDTDVKGEYNLAAYLPFAEDEGYGDLVKALWSYSEAAEAYKLAKEA